MRGNIFPPCFVFDSKTRCQFRPACKNIRDKSLEIKSEDVIGLLTIGKMRKRGELYKKRGEMKPRIQN